MLNPIENVFSVGFKASVKAFLPESRRAILTVPEGVTMKRPPPVISPGCCSTLPTSGDDHCQLPQVLPPHALFPRQGQQPRGHASRDLSATLGFCDLYILTVLPFIISRRYHFSTDLLYTSQNCCCI
ncbi:hypothetical protein JG688_00002451 [Phytophthora aleatoria]|uniref:Uncharacterized protein n=1 Tax=Phytophthora aleatoria TaxID=2496075 RepID=A0A8J5J0S6_9STRA|nr:hypothetical protein JG688_00002451 [Phytophthora aleatoria]